MERLRKKRFSFDFLSSSFSFFSRLLASGPGGAAAEFG